MSISFALPPGWIGHAKRRGTGSRFPARDTRLTAGMLGEQFTIAKVCEDEACRFLGSKRRHGDGGGLVLSR